MTSEPAKGTGLKRTANSVDLSQLTKERALELCKTSPELAAQLLMAVVTTNTSELPDTVFVRRSPDGILMKQRTMVRLSVGSGHLLPVGKDKNKVERYGVTMDGLRRMNEVASLQPMRPSEVIVDGKPRMNPYIEVDPESQMPRVVYARCLAIGRAPGGTLVATDAMIRLDVNIYLMETIQAKMKWEDGDSSGYQRKSGNQAGGQATPIGLYGTRGEVPKSDHGEQWVFMPLHSVGGIGLWVNIRSPKFGDIMTAHTTRLKFLERLAQTFAERNAIKAHPAIPHNIVVERETAIVPVTGWTDSFSMDSLNHLRDLMEAGRLHDFKDPTSGRQLQIEQVNVNEISEEDRAALDAEAAEERAQERREADDGGDSGPGAEEETDGRLDRVTELYSAYISAFTPAKGRELLQSMNIQKLEEATNDELDRLIGAIEEALQ